MTEGNGSIPDFTHHLTPFQFEGHTFRRRKVDPRDWAEVQKAGAEMEQREIDGKTGLVMAFSADGLHKLIGLAIHEDDLPLWNSLRDEKRIEFGEMTALRDWLWEQQTERPFPSDTPSFDGPGRSSEASSRDESPLPVEAPTG
jgi:hypothetical protein